MLRAIEGSLTLCGVRPRFNTVVLASVVSIHQISVVTLAHFSPVFD